MTSLKVVLRKTMAQLVFKEFAVEAARDVSAHFRRLTLSGESLRAAGAVGAGDKLQLMVPESGPRTYTPFAHEPSQGTCELLVYVHAETETTRWLRQLVPGARLRGFGPRAALSLSDLNGSAILVGDETSFATARALQDAQPSGNQALIFEITDPSEAERALSDLGVSHARLVQRQPGQSQRPQVEAELRAALSRLGPTHLLLTGQGQMIQAVRTMLKAQPAPDVKQRAKAYWADGKRGLD